MTDSLDTDRVERVYNHLKKNHGAVPRLHPFAFLLAALFTTFTLVTASYLTLFTTGTLQQSVVIEYIGLAFLNVLALPLAKLGIVNSQPWWVWYLLAFQWFGLATSVYLLYKQLTGTLAISTVHTTKSTTLKTLGWVLISALIAGVITTTLGWTLQQGAELMYAISANFLALPIAIFTPLLDFNPEIWALILALWLVKLKL